MGNTWGKTFRVTTFGESHGGAVGCVVDGFPAGLAVDIGKIQQQLNRRRPGQSILTTPRNEPDAVEIVSGLESDTSLGTPITCLVRNTDHKPEHYKDVAQVFRPSHADFTTQAKFGIRSKSGGGRASARETIGRVAAGALAEQMLISAMPGFKIVAWVDEVKGVCAKVDASKIQRSHIDQNNLRCPDAAVATEMEKIVVSAKASGDSVGGVIACEIHGLEAGLGSPVFDKLHADLAKAMMSLPATRGFEVGEGFASTAMFGSEHNDAFVQKDGRIRTASNRSGGVQGGISNGEVVRFRVAFKPVATIFKDQDTVDDQGRAVSFKPQAGRHDPCVLPRAVPMVEAMAALVIADHYLRQKTIRLK